MAMADAIGKDHVSWDDLTKVNIVAIADHIKNTHAPNSARTLLAVIKSFLNIYSETGLIPLKDFAKLLTGKKVPSQHIALTEEEIKRFIAYEPKTQLEEDVKILAIREILTGARGSDSDLLTTDNIHDGCISYVSKKTSRESVIPMHAMLKKYLTMKPKREHTRATKNKALKDICKAIGMTQKVTLYVGGKTQTKMRADFVAFHTLRRTFASVMASKGVPIPVVSKWMGHSNTNQTNGYICIDMSEQNKKYAELFK